VKIEQLSLKNFKAFRDVTFEDIPQLCVLVGANGSGKSTFFGVFDFLKTALMSNVQVAVTKLGGSRGFSEIRTRQQKDNIEIEIKFRERPKGPLITYYVSIGEERGRAFVHREVLKYRRGSSGRPWHFLDFSKGQGTAVTNEMDEVTDASELIREEQSLKSADILAVKGLAQFQRFPAVMALGDLIENWHVSDFHISRARQDPDMGYAEHLSREGENLALVAEFLHKEHPDLFAKVLLRLAERVPGIKKVDAKITEEGKVLLRFTDEAFSDPFLSKHVSDGTMKMFAYLLLLYDPSPHPLLCIEEPENQLYPSLLHELAEEFRDYARRGGQVFVSTHSPDFLNAIRLDEVFWLSKEKGFTKVTRAQDDPQIKAYMNDGDQMGYLWKQGFFDGVHPS